jgi:MerR HTH family regulatory protein
MIDLDALTFDAAQVARLAGTDMPTVQTWTTRGITDPYRVGKGFKRGRGRARFYSFRDVLKFYLMAKLRHTYRMPLPRGIDICRMVFGDSFIPDNARFMVVRTGPIGAVVEWYPDASSLAKKLSTSIVDTVVNVGLIVREVSLEVNKLLRAGELGHDSTT